MLNLALQLGHNKSYLRTSPSKRTNTDNSQGIFPKRRKANSAEDEESESTLTERNEEV